MNKKIIEINIIFVIILIALSCTSLPIVQGRTISNNILKKEEILIKEIDLATEKVKTFINNISSSCNINQNILESSLLDSGFGFILGLTVGIFTYKLTKNFSLIIGIIVAINVMKAFRGSPFIPGSGLPPPWPFILGVIAGLMGYVVCKNSPLWILYCAFLGAEIFY